MDIIGIIIFLIAVIMTVTGAYVVANAICQRSWKEKVPQIRLIGFASTYAVSFLLLDYFLIQTLEVWPGTLSSIAIACLIATIVCQISGKEQIPYFRLSGFICAFVFSFTLLGLLMCMAMAMTFGR